MSPLSERKGSTRKLSIPAGGSSPIQHADLAKNPPMGVRLVPMERDTLQKLDQQMFTDGPTMTNG